MRVVVTGGSGFVGSHVVDALLKARHDVVIADVVEPKWHAKTMFQKVNVRDADSLATVMDGAQVVMHLAGIANTEVAKTNPMLAVQVTCQGTMNVLMAAHAFGVERVVVAASTLTSMVLEPITAMWPEGTEFYGLPNLVVDEWCPVSMNPETPRHPYVTTKLFQELITRDVTVAEGLPHTLLRYGIMYGERMTPGVVAHTFIERALAKKPLILHGEGQQWRQYTHVQDIARAHVAVLEHWDESENDTFHVAGREIVTIADMAEAVCKAVPGTTVEYGPERPGDIVPQYCMVERAKARLGWETEIGLTEGIDQTVRWYKKHLGTGMPRK